MYGQKNSLHQLFWQNWYRAGKNYNGNMLWCSCKRKTRRLYFLIASPGGHVDAGISLYNFLQSLPVKIIMHNIGSIDSIANVIFMAGEERIASPHSTFLFHGVKMEFNGQVLLSLPQINELRDRVKKNHATIAGIISENSKMSVDEIEKLFMEGETKDVTFATDKGIITKIELPQIPKDAPLLV